MERRTTRKKSGQVVQQTAPRFNEQVWDHVVASGDDA
jgi:hypothetical protein